MVADDGFLSRWSRRKTLSREGAPQAQALAPVPPPGALSPVGAAPAASPSTVVVESAPAGPGVAPGPAAPPPAPTMDDVAHLQAGSDFSSFVAPHVDPQVRNAAMKKLFFSDPHFNVMDGLDTYIDDYNRADPLPRAVMRQLMQARTLGLLDDELEEQDPPPAPATPAHPDPGHEDADLQLQRHDAAGSPGAGAGDGPAHREGDLAGDDGPA